MFSPQLENFHHFHHIKLSSANSLSLEAYKICRFGKASSRNDKILDLYKLKSFVDDKYRVSNIRIYFRKCRKQFRNRKKCWSVVFSLFPRIFYSFRNKFQILVTLIFVVCECFEFGLVYSLVRFGEK